MRRSFKTEYPFECEEICVSGEVIFYSVSDVVKMTGWSEKTVLKIFNDPSFPAANYGKGKIVENHALMRFFSVRREKELDRYWNSK